MTGRILLLFCLSLTVPLSASSVTNDPDTVQGLSPRKLPSAWFSKAKGYEKALALQKETGADLFVYFSRQAPNDEAGLCQWFENKALTLSKLKDYLQNYIRIEVPLPSNPDCQDLAESFGVRKCPAVYIVQFNGWTQACKAFNWSTGRPQLYPPEEFIELLRARSSERYSSIPEQ